MAVVQLLRLRHLALWFPLEAVDSYGSVVRNLEEHISVPRWVGEGVVEGSPPTSQVPVEKLVESHMVIVVHQNARVSATNLMLHPRIMGNSKVITSVWLNKDMKPTLIQSIKKNQQLFCLRLCSEKCSMKIKTHTGVTAWWKLSFTPEGLQRLETRDTPDLGATQWDPWWLPFMKEAATHLGYKK